MTMDHVLHDLWSARVAEDGAEVTECDTRVCPENSGGAAHLVSPCTGGLNLKRRRWRHFATLLAGDRTAVFLGPGMTYLCTRIMLDTTYYIYIYIYTHYICIYIYIWLPFEKAG